MLDSVLQEERSGVIIARFRLRSHSGSSRLHFV